MSIPEQIAPGRSKIVDLHNLKIAQFLGLDNLGRLDSVQEDRHAKVGAYVREVVRPLGMSLLKRDPDSSVSVSGSFAQTTEVKLRTGSDCDFLIFSPLLRDPSEYIQFLFELRANNLLVTENRGIVPIFFTQVNMEEATRYIAEQSFVKGTEPKDEPGYVGQSFQSDNLVLDFPVGQGLNERILPVHFLFYPSRDDFLLREPGPLAKDLLRKSEGVSGSIDRQINGEVIEKEQGKFDRARWNIERALAELIPNYDVLPKPFLVRRYKQVVLNTIRGEIGDYLYHGTEVSGNTGRVLDALARDFGFCSSEGGIGKVFADIFEIHENDNPPSSVDLKGLVVPAYLLLKLIDSLEQSFGRVPKND